MHPWTLADLGILKESELADEYYRTGKVEGYDVELENGCLTMYALDQSEELSIMIEGGHEEW